MEGGVEVLPAVRVDLVGVVLSGHVAVLDRLANDEHAVVDLAHAWHIAPHQAQQLEDRSRHLRTTKGTEK
eukprot:6205365-Pleurochrysis_carterae.AAC.1